MNTQEIQEAQESDGAWWRDGLKRALALPASVQIIGRTILPCLDPMQDAVNLLPPSTLPPSLANASPKRKSEYLAGRHCAAMALQMAGCEQAAPPAMGADRLPLWPPGWLGCITHGNGEAIAAVSGNEASRLLGIDVERLIDPALVDGIGALVALEEELALFSGCTLSQALTILFSAKESLYKALYPEVQRFMDFSAARVTWFAPGMVALRLAEDWHPAWPEGSMLTVRYALRGNRAYTALHLPR
jgi:enterobactin synthetase component D